MHRLGGDEWDSVGTYGPLCVLGRTARGEVTPDLASANGMSVASTTGADAPLDTHVFAGEPE